MDQWPVQEVRGVVRGRSAGAGQGCYGFYCASQTHHCMTHMENDIMMPHWTSREKTTLRAESQCPGPLAALRTPGTALTSRQSLWFSGSQLGQFCHPKQLAMCGDTFVTTSVGDRAGGLLALKEEGPGMLFNTLQFTNSPHNKE